NRAGQRDDRRGPQRRPGPPDQQPEAAEPAGRDVVDDHLAGRDRDRAAGQHDRYGHDGVDAHHHDGTDDDRHDADDHDHHHDAVNRAAAIVLVTLAALASGCGGGGLRGDLAATGDNMG